MAYLTLFPIGNAMRANLMVYREMTDPVAARIQAGARRKHACHHARPRAHDGEFRVSGSLKVRPADLYVSEGHLQPGIVLVGDAFATSCPAAGTGATKVFTDVQRLCNVHIPQWLATDGMGADKIAGFYRDPEKVECEAQSLAKAYHLRSLSIDNGLSWRARRWARFFVRLSQGIRWAVQRQFPADPASPNPATRQSAHPRHGRVA